MQAPSPKLAAQYVEKRKGKGCLMVGRLARRETDEGESALGVNETSMAVSVPGHFFETRQPTHSLAPLANWYPGTSS